jgi:hypothetical protein
MRASFPQRLIESSQRAATVTRDKAGGIQPDRFVAHALQHRQANEGLRAAQKDASRVGRIAAVECGREIAHGILLWWWLSVVMRGFNDQPTISRLNRSSTTARDRQKPPVLVRPQVGDVLDPLDRQFLGLDRLCQIRPLISCLPTVTTILGDFRDCFVSAISNSILSMQQ